MKGTARLAPRHQVDGKGTQPGLERTGHQRCFPMKTTLRILGASGPCKEVEAMVTVLLQFSVYIENYANF